MNLLQHHLKVIQAHQPQAWQGLKDIYDSAFELDNGEIQFLGRSWDTPSYSPTVPPHSLGIMLYGMGDGQLIKTLLAQLPAITPVLVIDSQPELAWACLNETDFSTALADPRLRWMVGKPDTLFASFTEALLQQHDQLGLIWLENPLISQIAQLLNDPFLKHFRHLKATLGPQQALAKLPQLEELFLKLAPEMTQTHQQYPLSCRSGCADCCHGSVGFHLCVNPLEWALMHRSLSALPRSERQVVFKQAVTSLASHRDYLVELLYYFDTQPDRLNHPDFHLELLQMAGTHRQEACLMLDEAQRCRVYTGRPLTCRVFGSSHVSQQQPFTCEKDYQQMEQILLDEGAQNHLVDSSAYRKQLRELHQNLEYKHVLNIWLLCHLDFSQGDFKPLRIDYQQFQTLIRHPETLERLLSELEQAAQVSGGTETL